jgi:hypothetical protein
LKADQVRAMELFRHALARIFTQPGPIRDSLAKIQYVKIQRAALILRPRLSRRTDSPKRLKRFRLKECRNRSCFLLKKTVGFESAATRLPVIQQLKTFRFLLVRSSTSKMIQDTIKIVGLISKIKQTLTRAKQEKMAY